jgi:predicted ATPase with chaperone activity
MSTWVCRANLRRSRHHKGGTKRNITPMLQLLCRQRSAALCKISCVPIADLDGEKKIEVAHLAEAIQYRPQGMMERGKQECYDL